MKASRSFCCRILQGTLLCLALLSAARAAENPPTVGSILDKFIEASGGRTAMEKIKSRAVRGDLDIMGTTSDWVMEAKPPNKQFSGFTNSTLGTVADGFDGTVAWSKNDSGVRVKEGEELAKTKRDAEFYRFLNFKKLYPDLKYKGNENVDGEEVYVLESKPTGSSMERLSISTKSNLLIRQEAQFEGPQGKIDVTVRLTDFRPVDGVKYAHNMKFKLRAGEQELEFSIKLKEVKHNMAIEDAKFAKPAS
jgi:hypothetical protein